VMKKATGEAACMIGQIDGKSIFPIFL